MVAVLVKRCLVNTASNHWAVLTSYGTVRRFPHGFLPPLAAIAQGAVAAINVMNQGGFYFELWHALTARVQ